MQEVHCPVTKSYHSADEVLSEIAPLVEFLEKSRPAAADLTFPRGTVTADGRLDLCKQSIGIEGCALVSEALKENRTINAILYGTDGIGDAGAAKVAELIDENENLETVYLGCNGIGADGARSLAESLERNRSVRGLWLKRNPLGAEGARRLAQMLRKNSTLKVLDLVNTALEREGLDAILKVLIEENRSLKKIYLSGNRIDAAQAERLRELLIANDSLETLMLSVNALKDEGARLVADGLRENAALTQLSLASNGISATGGVYLLESLSENRVLRHLDLGYAVSTRVLGAERNAFGDRFAPFCRDFLKTNKALRHLDLVNTGIGQTGLRMIEEGVLENYELGVLKVNGRLSAEAKNRLASNAQNAPGAVSRELQAIRSVYRTAK